MGSIWELLQNIGLNYTLLVVLLGVIIFGMIVGTQSFHFIIRDKSIFGDAVAHSTLPGICIAFLIIGGQNKIALLVGALIATFFSIVVIELLSKKTKLKQDGAISVTLALFFGGGIACLSYIQTLRVNSQAGLEHFIFGNIVYITIEDIIIVLILAILILGITIAFWKEYKLILFDREYAEILGMPVKKLELLQLIMFSFTIIIGIQIMGVILIIGTLIAPAIAARQLSNRYFSVILLSSVFGCIGGIFGTLISTTASNLPPGPIIIVVMTLISILAIIFKQSKNNLKYWLHKKLFHRKVNHKNLFIEFLSCTNHFEKNEGYTNLEFGIDDYPDLNLNTIKLMITCGFCKKLSANKYILTFKGLETAKKITRGELYSSS